MPFEMVKTENLSKTSILSQIDFFFFFSILSVTFCDKYYQDSIITNDSKEDRWKNNGTAKQSLVTCKMTFLPNILSLHLLFF